MTKKLVLLGYVYNPCCVHDNTHQRERAVRAFARLAPKAITLELNTNHMDARQIPVMDAAILYAGDNTIPVHDVDEGYSSRVADVYISTVTKRMTVTVSPILAQYLSKYGDFKSIPRSIRAKLLANPHVDLEKHGIELGPDVLYDIYRKFTDGSIPVEEMRAYFEGYGMHIGHPSDALMAAHIRRIFGQHEDGMILHIGGIFHMIELGEAPTLLRLLKDLNPERLLLADF